MAPNVLKQQIFPAFSSFCSSFYSLFFFFLPFLFQLINSRFILILGKNFSQGELGSGKLFSGKKDGAK